MLNFSYIKVLLGLSSDQTFQIENPVEEQITPQPIKKIILIHGAGATPNCFNFLKLKLDPAEYFILQYQVENGFYVNLEQMLLDLKDYEDQEFYIICHSMGGIYALHLLQFLKIKKVVSISTPFNGSSMADWAKYMMPNHQLFKDVSTKSLPISQAKKFKIEIPWVQIVTTRGNVPWIRSKNDGVVSVLSQTCRSDIEYVYLEHDHYEVLVSEDTSNYINSFFKDIS